MQDRLRRGPGDVCKVYSFEAKDYPDTKIKLHFSHFKILVRGRRGWPWGETGNLAFRLDGREAEQRRLTYRLSRPTDRLGRHTGARISRANALRV